MVYCSKWINVTISKFSNKFKTNEICYLKMVGQCCLNLIMSNIFCPVRYVLFGFVWAITAGNHHFWLLPNLTEDVGVLESFVPLYSRNYVGTKKDEEEKTGEEVDKESKNGTSEDKQEPIDESKRDAKDEEDQDRNNEG